MATMSPVRAMSMSVRSLECISTSRPMRSLLPLLEHSVNVPFSSMPLRGEVISHQPLDRAQPSVIRSSSMQLQIWPCCRPSRRDVDGHEACI